MRTLACLALAASAGFAQAGKPPMPGNGDGPWAHRVLLATSKDGLSWEVGPMIAESASVPELFEDREGRAIVLFVDGKKFEMGAFRETADGKWERVATNLKGVDANVVAVEGGFRAYVKSGLKGEVDVYESKDGLDWK